MSTFETLLLRALGMGGVIGSAARLVAASDDLSRTYNLFQIDFDAANTGRNDLSSQKAVATMADLRRSVATFGTALAELRRSLRL